MDREEPAERFMRIALQQSQQSEQILAAVSGLKTEIADAQRWIKRLNWELEQRAPAATSGDAAPRDAMLTQLRDIDQRLAALQSRQPVTLGPDSIRAETRIVLSYPADATRPGHVAPGQAQEPARPNMAKPQRSAPYWQGFRSGVCVGFLLSFAMVVVSIPGPLAPLFAPYDLRLLTTRLLLALAQHEAPNLAGPGSPPPRRLPAAPARVETPIGGQ